MKFRLKEFRQAKRLFQSEMAEVLGANQSTVSRMELRPVTELSQQHYRALCDKFGSEEVNAFICPNETLVEVSGNMNNGGTQDNSVSVGGDAMDIIRRQVETMAEMTRKQAEQTDRLLAILERLTGGESHEQGGR